MKYVALCLIAVGLGLIFWSVQDRANTVEDGTILWEVIALIGGLLCIVVGLSMFAVLLFMAM